MYPSGRTSRQEPTGVSDFWPVFNVLDIDRDGKISPDDLRTFILCMSGSNVASDEDIVGSMISVADSNKDGFVEFDEFERILGCRESSPGNGVMEDVFRVMDKDGDGKVGFDDLRSLMKWAGFSASDEDVKAMINLGGGDEKEGICYEGLLKILAVSFAGE